MAKWARVGEVPKKVPVNFVVDSDKHPVLAAWIYSFPHGEMGKTVRDILNTYAQRAAAGGNEAGGGGGAVMSPREGGGGGGGAPRGEGVGRQEDQSRATVHGAAVPREADGDSEQQASMDAGTARTLNQLDEGF